MSKNTTAIKPSFWFRSRQLLLLYNSIAFLLIASSLFLLYLKVRIWGDTQVPINGKGAPLLRVIFVTFVEEGDAVVLEARPNRHMVPVGITVSKAVGITQYRPLCLAILNSLDRT